jgi:serine kinase of HPr protein (carbohydrate metabolism regulator)
VLVEGEAGAGKTALAQVLVDRARAFVLVAPGLRRGEPRAAQP